MFSFIVAKAGPGSIRAAFLPNSCRGPVEVLVPSRCLKNFDRDGMERVISCVNGCVNLCFRRDLFRQLSDSCNNGPFLVQRTYDTLRRLAASSEPFRLALRCCLSGGGGVGGRLFRSISLVLRALRGECRSRCRLLGRLTGNSCRAFSCCMRLSQHCVRRIRGCNLIRRMDKGCQFHVPIIHSELQRVSGSSLMVHCRPSADIASLVSSKRDRALRFGSALY